MEVKTIKGISPEKWMKFKALAAKSNLPMGKLFENMIEGYDKRADDVWNKILYGEKIINDKEAKEMHKITRNTRKEKWVRNASHT